MTTTKAKTKQILTFFLSLLFCCIFVGCDFGKGSVLDIATQNGLEIPKEENQDTSITPTINEYNTTIQKNVQEISLYDTYLELKEKENYTGTFKDFLKEFLNDEENGVSNNIEYITNQRLMSAVAIYTAFPTRTGTKTFSGAGVFYKIDKETGDAYIITNYHVVYYLESTTANKISNDIKCYTYGQVIGASTPLNCTFIGGSMTYDLALLKVSASNHIKNGDAIEIDFADSNHTTVGENIIAIGNPEGDGISATQGIICVDSENILMQSIDETSTIKHRVLRIDAAINGGNSGGGVFDSSGKLIGIANVKIVDSSVDNIAYAIPSNIVKYVCDQIYRQCDGTTTSIKKVLLGVTIEIIDASSHYNGLKTEIVETIKVAEITSGAPVDGLLTVGSILDKIIITDNSNPLSPVSTEYDITRLFHIDAILQTTIGDTITFYTLDENGNSLEPQTLVVTEGCLVEIK